MTPMQSQVWQQRERAGQQRSREAEGAERAAGKRAEGAEGAAEGKRAIGQRGRRAEESNTISAIENTCVRKNSWKKHRVLGNRSLRLDPILVSVR